MFSLPLRGSPFGVSARSAPLVQRAEELVEETFERHAATAENINAADTDRDKNMTAYSGDGKTLKSLLGARPDKIQSDRLFRILNFLVEDRLGGRNRGMHQFDCAEPHAVAWQAGFNVPLEDIRVHSIKVVSGSNAGEERPPCENCSQWLEPDGRKIDPHGYLSYRIRQTMLDRSWRDRYRIGMGRMSGARLKELLK
ncbi:hypothetical protein [Vitiosangium sp. GDMCC 1.1324]|uniref:hypothetical protein n=1 Tax=Vitiosangium sp. (strain GDMCC 1.1324) TaxID=2138576 RepID=UPI000D3BC2A3|nr:hypothetical protein [Vitiosangium sp. GDMCC 1.1324]PTL80285.1 hypothetical protein DAT35_30310 [Vitiosangium sp. GDMCC 1.1324]